jgi:NADH-quinone oxidoreductase subunit E
MNQAVDAVLQKHPHAQRDSLIPILQEVQEAEGYLSEKAIVKVAEHIAIPVSKVFGVATFYNQFKFNKPGRFHIQVCRGTACHVLGSATVLTELENALGIKKDQTSNDGLFSLEVVACIGACGLAPVISVNGTFHAKVSPESIHTILNDYRAKASSDEDKS